MPHVPASGRIRRPCNRRRAGRRSHSLTVPVGISIRARRRSDREGGRASAARSSKLASLQLGVRIVCRERCEHFESGAHLRPIVRERDLVDSAFVFAPASDFPSAEASHSHVSRAASPLYVCSRSMARIRTRCTISSEASSFPSRRARAKRYSRGKYTVKNSSNAASSPAMTRRARARSLMNDLKAAERLSVLSVTGHSSRPRSESSGGPRSRHASPPRPGQTSCLR